MVYVHATGHSQYNTLNYTFSTCDRAYPAPLFVGKSATMVGLQNHFHHRPPVEPSLKLFYLSTFKTQQNHVFSPHFKTFF